MTIRKPHAPLLLSVLLSTALSVFSVACGDDGDKNAGPATGINNNPSTVDASTGVSTTPPDAGSTGGDPGATAACVSKVYSELGDGCRSCLCGVDPVIAPSCGKPCWDFLACSAAAQAGKCAESAAGGAATRPAFEACAMEQCGDLLAIPGAEVISSYSKAMLTTKCALPKDGVKAVCADDISKIASTLRKP